MALLAVTGAAITNLTLAVEPLAHIVAFKHGPDAFQHWDIRAMDMDRCTNYPQSLVPISCPTAWTFADGGKGRLALLMATGQSALWAVLLIPAFGALHAVRRGITRARVVGAGLLVLAMVALVLLSQELRERPYYPIPGFAVKSDVLISLTVVAWLPAVIAILALNGILLELLGTGELDRLAKLVDGPDEQPPNLVVRFVHLRDVLNQSLLVLAAIVGAAILTLGVLRNAILAWDNNAVDDSRLPLELLVAEGLFFSSLLALLFIPTYVRLQSVGHALVARYAPPANPGLSGWEAAADRNRRLVEVLQLNVTPLAAFQAGAVILAPLASSALSVAFQSR